jgi:hypothetical protein
MKKGTTEFDQAKKKINGLHHVLYIHGVCGNKDGSAFLVVQTFPELDERTCY